MRKYYERLFSVGLLDKNIIHEAEKELEEWAMNPHAIRNHSTFFVAGTV